MSEVDRELGEVVAELRAIGKRMDGFAEAQAASARQLECIERKLAERRGALKMLAWAGVPMAAVLGGLGDKISDAIFK